MPTVLLVQVTEDDRIAYTEYLRAQGFEVVPLDNTGGALPLAPAADIIVTGIAVPGPFDGLELVRRLRAGAPTAGKPIIVLTAHVFDHSRQEAVAAGCDLFLAKPCLPDTLTAEIRRLLLKKAGVS